MRGLDEIYTATPFYGSRRMQVALARRGLGVNRKRVQRLMRLMGLEAVGPKPRLSAPVRGPGLLVHRRWRAIGQRLVRVVRELIREPKLSDEAFEAAQRIFGNQGLMDIAGLIGHYTLVNYTLKAFDVQRPPGSELTLPSLP